MARRSRDEYAKASGVFGLQPGKTSSVEDMEKVPERPCGLCKHFLESAWSSDGRGSCKVLKEGSDITCDPPVFVREGKNGYMMRILTDASRCTYYERNEFIDKDGYECSDPAFRRFIRQLRDK
ncbi:MAG: hypothetical protein JW743_03085 [Deltaproteobacteria bacterium]|nr:hypothetical protein [Deltaproteobacteria bacterium]MBN2845771.1 hypothetical protein [Deltaproteobacteria bacterium]